jgi:hypothetical protein
VYNASTHHPVSIKEFLQATFSLLDTSPEIINASLQFLDKYNIQQWQDLPMWISGFDMQFDNKRLREDFSTKLSSFEVSVEKTIEYYASEGWKIPRYGLSLEKETELIRNLVN